MRLDFFGSESFPCEGLGRGSLKPLTLAQMEEMRGAIADDIFSIAAKRLNKETVAHSAIAAGVSVSGMTYFQQAQAIINSPFLLAKCAAMMLGHKEWMSGPMLAANEIPTKHIPQIRKAVWASYGYDFTEDDEEPVEDKEADATAANPPTAAG